MLEFAIFLPYKNWNSPSKNLICNSLNTLRPTKYQYKQNFWQIIYSNISDMEEINNRCKESVTKHCEYEHYACGNLFLQWKQLFTGHSSYWYLPLQWHVTILLHAIEVHLDVAVQNLLQHRQNWTNLLSSSWYWIHNSCYVKCWLWHIVGGKLDNTEIYNSWHLVHKFYISPCSIGKTSTKNSKQMLWTAETKSCNKCWMNYHCVYTKRQMMWDHKHQPPVSTNNKD